MTASTADGSGRLAGKVAIVTGAARGIGRGIAEHLAALGAKVVVNYVNAEEAARDVVSGIEARGGTAVTIQGDVGIRADAEALVAGTVERFGRVDVLVNNAGICPFRDFFEITDDVWEITHRTNLYGPFVTSQAAARVMRDQGGGVIIHITSVTANFGGPQQVHYAATKGGLNSMTSSMAVALGPYNIRVNAVLPGGVPTDINKEQRKNQDPNRKPGLPINRPGSPADIAGAVAYLASDEAAWVTGVMLPVDGGVSII